MQPRIGDPAILTAKLFTFSNDTGVSAKILFLKEDDQEYDWDQVFRKQFIPFIKQVLDGCGKIRM